MKYLWLVGLAIGVDQLVKYIAQSGEQAIHQGSILSIPVAIIVLIWALLFAKNSANIGLSLLIAGGISNTIDAVALQSVRDIFIVKNVAFNMADIAVITGAAIIVSQEIIKYHQAANSN